MIAPILAAAAALAQAAPPTQLPRAPELRVGAGFRAEVYARGLVHPTALAFGPGGRLYATQEAGSVVSVGRGSRSPRLVAAGFSESTLGLAWRGSTLFVSTKGRIERLETRQGRAVSRRTIVSGLPNRLHQQDNVVVYRGRLYFGNGSTCNACRERDRRSATILSVRFDGGGLRIEASGLRNPFGLAVDARTGRLFVSENARDDLGRGEPAESVVRFRRGARYGWPDCSPSWRTRRLVGSCAGVRAPLAYLEPHSSADGIVVYRGRSFPARFRGAIFVAEWGQYAASFSGRKVVRIVHGGPVDFARGFVHPLALAVDPAGALLVADWSRGTIYRIQARGRP